MPADNDIFEMLLTGETERRRFRTLKQTLRAWRELFTDKRALDYGSSWGTSIAVLILHGAAEVVGVEPDAERVIQGQSLLRQAALNERAGIRHVADTTALPFGDGEFDFAIANAVLEHIAQPRAAHIRELWRTLRPGGHLMINETPNSLFPKEMHTTGLWLNHWLSKEAAYRRAIRLKRYTGSPADWEGSGWRGLHYYELTAPLKDFELIPEQSRARHRALSALGLPASLFDPYPTWVLRKRG